MIREHPTCLSKLLSILVLNPGNTNRWDPIATINGIGKLCVIQATTFAICNTFFVLPLPHWLLHVISVHESLSSSWLRGGPADSVFHPFFFFLYLLSFTKWPYPLPWPYISHMNWTFFFSCSPDLSRLRFQTLTESLTHSFQVDMCNRYPKLHISKINSWFLTPNICDSFYRFSTFITSHSILPHYSWQISFRKFSFSHIPHAIVASLEAVLSKG